MAAIRNGLTAVNEFFSTRVGRILFFVVLAAITLFVVRGAFCDGLCV